MEEVGFGFGGGGEAGGGAREGEEISGRILQAGRYFQVSFWGKRSDPFSQNGARRKIICETSTSLSPYPPDICTTNLARNATSSRHNHLESRRERNSELKSR